MITGYKREKLGRPSDKLSGDVPRAGWRAVIVSEVIFPIIMAVIFVAAYLFVKSFPDKFGNQPPSPLIRIAVVSLGPFVWNAAILLVLFILSLSIGPILEPRCSSFGSIIAAIAHISAIVGMVGSFEFLWFLEFWEASHAVLGLIAVIAIQRAVHKVLIGVFLSRELKHDETNRAWWTGRWYGRGFGASAMSQSAREFLVKIIELSLWSSDLLIGHFLLFVMTPLVLVPYIDRVHSTLLFWLRPSKQIRSPLYSIKHRKRRRWIIAKYGIIFVTMICLFVALIGLPVLFYADSDINISCVLCDYL